MDFFFFLRGGGYDDYPAMVLQGDGYGVLKNEEGEITKLMEDLIKFF